MYGPSRGQKRQELKHSYVCMYVHMHQHLEAGYLHMYVSMYVCNSCPGGYIW